MKRIAFTRADGGVSIMTPESPESLEAALSRCPPGAVIVDDEDLPKDRSTRNSWKLKDGVVSD